MRKLLVVIICLLCGSTVSLYAQAPGLAEREAEWKGYALPQTNFSRQVIAEHDVVFRVPADWNRQGESLLFTGPHGAQLTVLASTVPDGYPLTEFVAGTLKATADEIGSAESILTRQTQFQDLEAREILLETPDGDGKMFRSTTWLTILGPLAFRISLLAPVEHATALEPFFKGAVQSVMFAGKNFARHQAARLDALPPANSGPIHEIENIVDSLNQLNSDREGAINRLTLLFVSQPEAAVDLIVDRRVAVRSAAAEALVRSKKASLKTFLWHILDDSDPFVAQVAARSLGQENGVVSELLNRSWTETANQTSARVWPFMTKEDRASYIQGLFNQTLPDRKVQTAALVLLRAIPGDQLKLPLARILAAKDDSMTNVALRVASDRGELLPVDVLMKLAASPNQQIKRLAVENLGQSAAVSDIPRLEAMISKISVAKPSAKDEEKKHAAERKALDEEIKLSIKKIHFRNDLTLAKSAEAYREVIRKATLDTELDDFAWRFDCEITSSGCSPATAARNLPPDFKIKSFAENILPRRVGYYTAIPNPGQAVQRFYETLHGLQLDSPRAQANLILIMGGMRQRLGQKLGAPADAPALIDYTGINSDSPIVLASWTADGAHDSVTLAERRAIVLRVKDRERFERVVEDFQQTFGSFMYLTDYLAVGTRAAAALPAFLPFVAQAMLSADPYKPASSPLVRYSLVGQTEWNGIPIKTIEHQSVGYDASVSGAVTYLTFIGDVAILTYDLATIRDLLSRANTAEQESLAGNEEFRRAATTDADVVYFSDLNAVLADQAIKKSNESGALKFSSSSWENSHRLVFEESEWSKPLLPFHPKDLSAPRDLLPSSTLAYFLMKLDVAAAWEMLPKTLNLRESRFEIDPAIWSGDFSKEVMPELGPECGAVLLELPDLDSKQFDPTWAAFCKLKSNKLAEAFAAGRLFRGVGPTNDTAEIKGETSYFVAVKNGFLVVSNAAKGVSALGGKTNLAATRDYSRAAEKAPSGIIAFGGYNLEAAVAAASANTRDGLRAQMAGILFSVASAFHSQSFFATASAGTVEGHSSVAMDREGRYAIADFSYLPRATNITYATLQPHGMPIIDQQRLSDIVLKVRAKAPGPIDSIRDDIKSSTQRVEQKSPNELIVTIAARRNTPDKKIQLPVTNPEVAAFVKATSEIASDNRNVIEQARQIAGDDRDAWSVAQKLGEWTHQNLTWKSVARAGAVETLATREADCSEFSELYVAMARSLGLPARIVSGLAYSGNSFGGHAWVEVWVGEWIELDPTWGTHFVDATHVRNQNATLVTAAALNLLDVEIVETRRTVADFQKSARSLSEHLVKAIMAENKPDVEATIDLAMLTDEFMGAGAWNGLNERERDLMSSAYRRAVQKIVADYDSFYANGLHLLHLAEKDDHAEALLFNSPDDVLIKFRLLRRGDVWYLVDVVQPDPGIEIAAEAFGVAMKSIEAGRTGKKTNPRAVSVFETTMALIEADEIQKALETVERALQAKPTDQSLRFLKVQVLYNAPKKEEEYTRLLTELSNEQPAYAPALYDLASVLSEEKPEEAIQMYKRYSALEPHDPRGYRELAGLYEERKEAALAEAAYRKAIDVDPFEIPGYEDLAIFMVRSGRVKDVPAVLLASDKYATVDDDVLATVFSRLEKDMTLGDASRLAVAEAKRLEKSVWANLALSDIFIREKSYGIALAFMKRAAAIDPKLAHPHIAMATAYLQQSRLNEALRAIDHALKLEENNIFAHYRRATVLARLGRRKEAMTALQKSIELDEAMLLGIAEEEDFKSLRALPAFKKLLADAEKLSKTVPQ
ncbi:MAG TPA: transglutaminase domain-containing protein [Pyrinomonadaceae bacterium]|nr:transglutaminase domain-containing protein [Pyrinomonadaceae bacterium]